jgi:hypothetical protein
MKQFLSGVAIVAVALLVTALPGGRPLHAQAGPSVTVNQASGSQDDTFVFTGRGFNGGQTLVETYTDPSGTQYTFYASDGSPSHIVSDDAGNWTVTVLPRTDFSGAYSGTWLVSFCTEDTQVCLSGAVNISS